MSVMRKHLITRVSATTVHPVGENYQRIIIPHQAGVVTSSEAHNPPILSGQLLLPFLNYGTSNRTQDGSK